MQIQEKQGICIHLSCISWLKVLCPFEAATFQRSVYPIFVFLYLQAPTDAPDF